MVYCKMYLYLDLYGVVFHDLGFVGKLRSSNLKRGCFQRFLNPKIWVQFEKVPMRHNLSNLFDLNVFLILPYSETPPGVIAGDFGPELDWSAPWKISNRTWYRKTLPNMIFHEKKIKWNAQNTQNKYSI